MNSNHSFNCCSPVKIIYSLCRESANNGHGHGAYNLVAAHMQGYNTDVQEQ